MKITQLRTNHIINLLGYAIEKPVFTWQVEDAKGKTQKAARLTISKTEDMTDLLYDTEWQPSLNSLACEIDLPLAPRTRYFWQVAVQSDAGEEAISDINWFETAKMAEAWGGKWITCDKNEPRHPIFTKNLPVKNKVVSARLYICGLGLYEAYLNGKRVGEEYFTPYSNDYNEWLQYQTFDITKEIKKGGDFKVMLGNGWYKGRFGFSSTPESPAFYGDSWHLMAEIRVRYADGHEDAFGTDESFQVTRSNIVFSNLYDGEHVDSTLPAIPLVAATLSKEKLAPLYARYSTPVTVHEKIKPVELIHTAKGEMVLDIGQNQAGIFALAINVKKGEKVSLFFGEEMQHGCFYRENLRSAKAEYSFVSDGTPQIIMPHFTFYGYRYVMVNGLPDLRKDDFTALALYSDIAPVGEIKTGSKLINKLIENTKWGQKGNYLDVPTDCPQRDERMGWTGDAQVFSPTAAYLTDCYAFMRKYLFDMAKEQAAMDGKVPVVVPSSGTVDAACAWGDATCIIPWNMYVFYGDVQILKEHYESMKAWVDYLKKVDGDTHEWGKQFHYGDWLALDLPSAKDDAVLGGTDEGFIANVYYRHSAILTAKAAKVLGHKKDEKYYLALADTLLKHIQDEYFSKTGRCCIDTQTAHIMTLYFGLSADKARAKAALNRLFKLSEGKLRTGFVGTPLMCNVLSDMNDSALAYRLLLNEEYPGWLREVKLGATTIWERWNSLDDDGLISSTGMNSLNHYAYGSIVEWIFRHAAGINPDENVPGFKKAILRPTPNRDLGSLKASYRSAAGLYKCDWKALKNGQVTLKITIPFNCTADLHLPDGVHTLDAGAHHFEYVLEGDA
jgi:Alpha-L-rhamnosidase N-terminal domain./Bacterial alpha-L-rhamnosidase.